MALCLWRACLPRSLPLAARAATLRFGSVESARFKKQGISFDDANAPLDPRLRQKIDTKLTLADFPRDQLQGESMRAVMRQMRELTQQRLYEDAIAVFRAVPEKDGPLWVHALSVCSKAYLPQEAFRLWGEMPLELKKSAAYGAMLECCKRGKRVQEAEQLLQEAEQRGIQMNIILYNTMIGVYSIGGLPDKALECLERARPLFAETNEVSKQMTFAAAMSATARAGDYARTRELFLSMQGENVPPNHVHFNALLTACTRAGDAATARAIFDSMPQWGLPPRLEDYTIMISCSRHNLAQCKELFDAIPQVGQKPNPLLYQEMVQAYMLADDVAGARAFLDAAPDLDRSPRKLQELISRIDELVPLKSVA